MRLMNICLVVINGNPNHIHLATVISLFVVMDKKINKKNPTMTLPAALHFPFLITWAGGGLFFRSANVLFIATCATSPHYIASNWIMPSVTRVDILGKYRFRVLWSHHKVRPFQSGVDRRNDNFQIWISKQRSQTCSVSLSRVWTTLERCNRTM